MTSYPWPRADHVCTNLTGPTQGLDIDILLLAPESWVLVLVLLLVVDVVDNYEVVLHCMDTLRVGIGVGSWARREAEAGRV